MGQYLAIQSSRNCRSCQRRLHSCIRLTRIDAGPADPQYNDRDGSRNDIGMFGGHNFIPDGRTTNKPIVLGLDIAPIAVPTGAPSPLNPPEPP